MNLDKKRWIILGAACFINLCLGSIYAWSVFSSAMADYFNSAFGMTVTAGDLAIVYTIANSVGPITMISGGWFNDKFGPSKVILTGGIMWGLGMFLSGFATGIPFLIVTYGIIGGLGLGMAYGSTISTCVKFFPDKRGLIGGVTTAVYGMSSVILPPIVTTLVHRKSAPFSFRVVGIAFIVLIVVSSMFLEQCPDGYMPKGYIPKAAVIGNHKNGGKAGSHGISTDAAVDMNWKQMIASPVFYAMMVLLTCGAFSGMMIISQASSVAQIMMGMTASAAGIAVSVIALFNAFGRLVAGIISDKLGRIGTLRIACILSIIGLLMLFLSANGVTALFYIGLCIVGMSFGSFMGVYPGFTADQFGPKNNSVNYGVMFIGFALAGYFGPQIMRNVFASTGTYTGAFLIAGVFSAVGIVLTFVYQVVTAPKAVAGL